MKKNINFAWPVTTLCKFDYQALQQCINSHNELFENKKIVIMGAGIRGTSFALLLQKFGYQNIIFTDNNEQKVGGYINEFPILPYKEIVKERSRYNNLIVIISVENGYILKKQLEDDGFVENKDFFYIENHLYELFLIEFLNKKNIKNLVLGDCGLTDVSKEDSDFTNVGEMIKNELGDVSTKILAVHALGMRAFYHILSAHIKFIGVPENMAVMANFETFTGKQHLLPRTQHAKLIHMISDAVSNQDEELREYAQITKERFENFKVDYFTSSQGVVDKMTKEKNDRIVIQMNYMYDLKEDNENIIYMNKLLQLCKEKGIKLLFFIPPVNYMYARELYGEIFKKKYQANVEKLKAIIDRENIVLLDLSYLLDSTQFADIHTIDETTNIEGRRLVATKIIEAFKGME